MESATDSNEVTRLYEQLGDSIRANNQARVEQTCRELVLAGRPFSEILRHIAGASNTFRKLAPEALNQLPYYWAPQWRAQPDFTQKAPKLAPSSAPTIGSNLLIEGSNRGALTTSDPEALGSAQSDWVQQWRARQELTHNESGLRRHGSDPANGPISLGSDLTSIAEGAGRAGPLSQNPQQNSNPGRRSSALLLPIASLYVGCVAFVGIGLFLLVHLGENKLAATPPRDIDPSAAPIVEGTSRTGDLAEQLPPARATVADEPSVPAEMPTIEALSADGSPEPHPGAADPMSSLTRPVASVMSPEPDPQLAGTLAITIPPVPPNNPQQSPGDRPSPVASDTIPKVANTDPALPNEAPSTVAAEPSVPAAKEVVVANATPAKASADARAPVTDRVSQSTRPAAKVISLEPTTRLVTAPPAPTSGPLPGAAVGPSQIGPDMAATFAKADPALLTNEAVPTIAAAPSVSPPDAAPAAKTALAKALPEARPPATDTAALVSRGDTLFGLRDIVSARLFYERAANAGNAQAAIRLGETFDPSFLARAGLSGVRGDPAVAVHWYRRARELGANEADVLATSIEGKLEP
jgi:hypothetical protein